MLTFLGCVMVVVLAVVAYKKGQADESIEAGRRWRKHASEMIDRAAEISNAHWHGAMLQLHQSYSKRLQDVIAVASRPDAVVHLPEPPKGD